MINVSAISQITHDADWVFRSITVTAGYAPNKIIFSLPSMQHFKLKYFEPVGINSRKSLLSIENSRGFS